MKITYLFSHTDGKSHFQEIDSNSTEKKELGWYSNPVPVKGLIFRDFEAGEFFDWHNAPQPQYIAYLEGVVEVEASSGEKKVFKPGDILLVEDLTGAGHITKTLTKGKSLIIQKA